MFASVGFEMACADRAWVHRTIEDGRAERRRDWRSILLVVVLEAVEGRDAGCDKGESIDGAGQLGCVGAGGA